MSNSDGSPLEFDISSAGGEDYEGKVVFKSLPVFNDVDEDESQETEDLLNFDYLGKNKMKNVIMLD